MGTFKECKDIEFIVDKGVQKSNEGPFIQPR